MRHSLAWLQKSRTSPPALLDHPSCNLTGVCILRFHVSRAEERPRTCTNTIVRLTSKHIRPYSSCAGMSTSAATFTGNISNIFRCLGVPVTFKLSSRVGLFLRGEGGHILRYSEVYRYRQTDVLFPVYITAVWTRQTTTY